MYILPKYVFKKILLHFSVVTPVIVATVWLVMSIKYIWAIINDSVQIDVFLKLITLIIPSILIFLLPICFCFSAIYTFCKMQYDNELVIMMTSGKSKLSIFSILLCFAIFLSLILYNISSVWNPLSYKKLTCMHRQIQSKISLSAVKHGVFNSVGASVVFIGNKNDYSVENVFISRQAKNKTTDIIIAEKGIYQIQDDRLYIMLTNGFHQKLDKDNKPISSLQFEQFSYDITDFVKKYSYLKTRLQDLTNKELKKKINTSDNKKIKYNLLAELHGRYYSSLIPMINALVIACFLITANSRARKRFNNAFCFSTSFILQLLVMFLNNFAKKSPTMIYCNYFIIAVVCFVLAYIAFVRKQDVN